MAKQITPQGYTYGSDPKSHHPFWEEVEVVEPLEIIPTEEEQLITAPEGVIGYNPITVKPAAAEPFLETLNVTPSTEEQFIDAEDYEVDGWNIVDVAPVTAAIDPNIDPYYIIKGIEILGVTGVTPTPNVTDGSRVVVAGLKLSTIQALADKAVPSKTISLTTREGYNGVIETFTETGERQEAVTWSSNPSANQIVLYATSGRTLWTSTRPKIYLTSENWQYIVEDLTGRGFVAIRFLKATPVAPFDTYNYLVIATVAEDATEYGVDIVGYLAR